MANEQMSAEKKAVKALLESKPEHGCVTWLDIIHQNGVAVAVEYSAKTKKSDKHCRPYKAELRVTEDMIEILEVVAT
jgi:hypothetical protein